MKDWIEHFRNLMLLGHLKRPEDSLNMSVENIEKLKEQSGRLSPSFINDSIFALAGTLNDARWSTQPRVLLEVGIVRMAAPEDTPATPTRAPASAKKSAFEIPSPPEVLAPPEIPSPPEVPTPAEKPAPTKDPAPPPVAVQNLDWVAVVAEAAKKSHMLGRLNGRSELVEIKEKVFIIEVFDDITKKTAEGNRELIEAAAARIAGTPLRMDCRLNAEDAGPKRGPRAGAPGPQREYPREAPPEEDREQIQETLNL
jgi:DNA polymerase-3 subunit gamma/tau